MSINKHCKIAIIAVIAGAFAVCTQAEDTTPYKVAVLPAWKNWFHVNEYNWVFKNNGFTWTNCQETAEQMEWLDKNLDDYDMLLAPALFHYAKTPAEDPEYTRPYNMEKLAPHIAKWIQNGGCFLGVDMNYPQAMEWYKLMDPLMDISANVNPADMKSMQKCFYFGPPIVEKVDPMLYFPRAAEAGFCWGHMVIPPEREKDSAWDVIATCGHGKGFPTLVVRRWGKGIIVLSSTRTFVPEFIQNIRVNQQVAKLGIAVTESNMPDPIPGKNHFSFVCKNSGDKPFPGELELTVHPWIRNPNKDWNNRRDRSPSMVDDPNFKTLVYKQASTAAPGTEHPFALDCSIPLRGEIHTIMKFRTGDTEAVIFDRIVTLPELFEISGPPYRSTIAVGRRFKDITFTTKIYPNEEDISDASVAFKLIDAATNTVAEATFKAEFGKAFNRVELPLNLAAGKYTISGTIINNKNGKELGSAEGVLDVVAPGPGLAAFDEDNTLILEGEPFLPLGIYHPRNKKRGLEGFVDVANVGFNVVNIFSWMGPDKLDILRPVEAYCLWEQLPHRGDIMAMEQAGFLYYHPSALINYTIDEPQEGQFNFVRDLDKSWRKYDPYHPTYLASYQPHHFRRNAEISDILAPDPYPYNPRKGDDSDLALVARRVELARAASDGVNPVFCVPQAFGKEPPDIWRNMGLQALVHGAKGLIWYAWNEGNPDAGGMVYNEELIACAETFLAQIKLLAPAILGDAANQPRMFTMEPGGTPVSQTIMGAKLCPTNVPFAEERTLHGMVCRDPKTGTRYLILVSTSKEPIETDLPIPEAEKVTKLEGAFDDPEIPVENSVAKVKLGKFGSGIWYWDGPKPVMPCPISDFAERELPARGSGKTLKVSVDGEYKTIQDAIDAAKDGDTIEVPEGNWDRIVCDNKLIDIVATGDRAKTIIAGKGNRAATLTARHRGDMKFETNTLVRGFVIMGGNAAGSSFRPKFGGGAIGGTFVDCLFQNNTATYGGGAAFANIYNCVFLRNSAKYNGGGVTVCNVENSEFNFNTAVYDGGAAEFSKITRSLLRNNTAGRRAGGLSFGTISYSEITGNKADLGGGAAQSSAAFCVFAHNHATSGGGATISMSPSFCTVAYNTIDTGNGSGVGSGRGGQANNCLVAYNTCKDNPFALQVPGFHHSYGANLWMASDVTNTPAGVPTFTKDAFLDAEHGNFRLTNKAPFINAIRDRVPVEGELDFYGLPRLSGAGFEPGASEMPTLSQVFYDIDATVSNPFVSHGPFSPALLGATGGRRPPKMPTFNNGAIVFDGTNATRCADSTAKFGFDRWQHYRFEIEFKAKGPGRIFTTGRQITASVTPEGKLNVISMIAPRSSQTNMVESVESVIGKPCKLVVDTHMYGATNTVVTATLNGNDLPVIIPFNWNQKRPMNFNFDGAPWPTFGDGNASFTGEITKFKLTGFVE